MSQWLKNPQLAAQAEALRGNLEKGVSSTTKKLSSGVELARGAINEKVYGDTPAHRVSDYPWRPKMFNLRATLHHGVPGNPVAMAFDPVQRLLAVGTQQGLVKVFGKPGVEVVVNQYPSPIAHLQFAPNDGKLVIVHSGNVIEAVNLSSKRPIGGYALKQDTISCVASLPLSPFVFVGTKQGHVNVFNAANGQMAMYAVSSRTQLDMRHPGCVTGTPPLPQHTISRSSAILTQYQHSRFAPAIQQHY